MNKPQMIIFDYGLFKGKWNAVYKGQRLLENKLYWVIKSVEGYGINWFAFVIKLRTKNLNLLN